MAKWPWRIRFQANADKMTTVLDYSKGNRRNSGQVGLPTVKTCCMAPFLRRSSQHCLSYKTPCPGRGAQQHGRFSQRRRGLLALVAGKRKQCGEKKGGWGRIAPPS